MKTPGQNRSEFGRSLVLFLFGAGYLVYASRYPLDSLANPGPGVFPLAVGVLGLGSAAWHLLHAARKLKAARPAPSPEGIEAGQDRSFQDLGVQWKPAAMIVVLVGYLWAMPRLGFLIPTALVVLACGKLMGTSGWWKPVLLALGVTFGCYVLFEVWLTVPLPKGLL